MAPWFFVDGTDGRNCQSREARQVASNLFVPEAAKNEKEFSSEDDRKIGDWPAVCAFDCRRWNLNVSDVSSKNPFHDEEVSSPRGDSKVE